MIGEALTYSRQINDSVDAVLIEVGGRPYSGKHQCLWRPERTLTQDDLFTGIYFLFAQRLDSFCDPAFKDHPCHLPVCQDLKIGRRLRKIGDRG